MMTRFKTLGLTLIGSSRSLIATLAVALVMHGHAVSATELPLTGNCILRDDSSLALVARLAWDHEGAIVARPGMEERARTVGLREHGDGFKLSLLYQDPILGPSETVVFSIKHGKGVQYRIGSVSYDVLADGTPVLGSMSPFEEALCAVN